MDKPHSAEHWHLEVESFRQAVLNIPETPTPVDEPTYLNRYGTVLYAINSRKSRSVALTEEWKLAAETQLPLHEGGLRHLEHLEATIAELKTELVRRETAAARNANVGRNLARRFARAVRRRLERMRDASNE